MNPFVVQNCTTKDRELAQKQKSNLPTIAPQWIRYFKTCFYSQKIYFSNYVYIDRAHKDYVVWCKLFMR